MRNIKSIIKTSLLAGIIAILPIAVLIGAFSWIFKTITGIIQPLTHLLFGKSDIKEIVGHIIVLTIILLICFLLGLAVKTGIGSFIHNFLERSILKKIFGYSLVKETVLQFVGNKKSPFSSVALCNIFGNETLVTAFVTDEHDDGRFTIFVPTGPNPTSGNIYHLNPQFVHKIDVSVEDTMRSIISCGSGSSKLLKNYVIKRVEERHGL